MSTINTNGIDVNYPVPGQNNSSQGFRNNFTAIRQNLNIAGSEISDLQNKVVLKSALANSTLNNDMANTLIANASTLQFRATTYNLGNALVGTVLIDCTLGDVQYGNIAGNITLDFGSWIPTNTQGGIELQLGRDLSNAEDGNAANSWSITFPSEAVFESRYGWPIIENSNFDGNTNSITFPNDLLQINLKLYSNDCGNTIFVQPINRPFKSTQIQYGVPPSTGKKGDVNGTIYVGDNVSQLEITSSIASDFLVTANTGSLYTGMPIVFTGVSFEANLVVGNTYYVGNIANSTHFTVSTNANASGNVNLAGSSGTMYANPIGYMYIAVDDYTANAYNRNITSTTAPNIITVDGSTANLAANYPIIFTATTGSNANTAGLVVDSVYYIKSVSGSNITVSMTRNNGVAGPEYQGITTVGTSNVDVDYTVFDGPDIFRRIPLQPF